jgi:hypothetical protein
MHTIFLIMPNERDERGSQPEPSQVPKFLGRNLKNQITATFPYPTPRHLPDCPKGEKTKKPGRSRAKGGKALSSIRRRRRKEYTR